MYFIFTNERIFSLRPKNLNNRSVARALVNGTRNYVDLGVVMWLGSRIWFKGVIIWASLSSLSWSNPLAIGFQSAMEAQFIAAGISQEQAINDARTIKDAVFDRAIQEKLEREDIQPETSLFDHLSSDININGLRAKNSEGRDGVIYTREKASYEDREAYRRMFKDKGFGDVIFKTYKTYDEVLDIADMNSRYALAPYWYASTGMFLYRSERPINSDGDYVYGNDPYILYKYGLGLSQFDLKTEDALIELGEQDGKKITFPVYRMEPKLYEDENDAILEFKNVTGNRYNLEYLYEKRLWDLSNSIQNEINLARTDFNLTDLYDIQSFLFNQAYMRMSIQEGNGIFLILKNRSDVQDENDTLLNRIEEGEEESSSNTKIPVYDNALNAKEKGKIYTFDYKITDESLAELYTKIVHNYSRQSIGSSGGTASSSSAPSISSKARSLLDSSFKFTPSSIPSFVSGSVSASDVAEPVKDYLKPKFVPNSVENDSDVVEQPQDNSKPKPLSIPITTNGGASAGGRNVGESDDISTDDRVGTNAISISNSQSGMRIQTQTNTQIGNRTETIDKEEDSIDENIDFSLIPGATNILQPLIDWRDSLLSAIEFSSPYGSCPVYSMTIFDVDVVMESHCLIFEKIAPILSVMSLIIWNILAFRIIFSA